MSSREMRDDEDFLRNSLIVGAHPDDEMLWFSSIVGQVDAVAIVFRDFWADPALGPARAGAMAELPLREVHALGIAEPGSNGCADWTRPVTTPYGLQLGTEETKREMKRVAKRFAGKVLPIEAQNSPSRVARHYEQNFRLISEALEPLLKPDMNVFTHNPWGEYGHEDHVQVFRALDALRARVGFRLWMTNYCSERALPLAMRYFRNAPVAYRRLPTDKALAEEIAAVYRRHGCWTWSDDWVWFEDECFMEAPRGEAGGVQHHLFPLNLFTLEQPGRSLRVPLTASAMAVSAMMGAVLMETL